MSFDERKPRLLTIVHHFRVRCEDIPHQIYRGITEKSSIIWMFKPLEMSRPFIVRQYDLRVACNSE